MSVVIQTTNLTKSYGKNRGISDVNISVNAGEVYGFIGPNGAGKSTMIKTLFNLLFPTGGSATVFGQDCVKDSRQIKTQTAYVPCEVNYYDELTVQALLDYSDSFYAQADKAYTQGWMQRFELEPKKKIRELSSGNKKKVALVAALAARPRLLILDEPTNGLDPLMRQTLFDALREQQAAGCTVFLSSHNLDEVQSLCDRVAIIREGKIIDVKTLGELSSEKAKKVTVVGTALPEQFNSDAYKIVSHSRNHIVFTYHSTDMGALLRQLQAMNADDFLVEDIKLSDIFMSYYNEGGAV